MYKYSTDIRWCEEIDKYWVSYWSATKKHHSQFGAMPKKIFNTLVAT